MKPVTAVRLAWWKVAAVMFGIALIAVACGSGGTPSGGGSPATTPAPAVSPSPTARPTSALCRDAAALRASLDRLTHVSVGAGTAEEINADLSDVKAKLDTLIADAGTQWQAQTSALKSAIGTLQTAVSNLAANPTSSNVSAVVSALGDAATAAQNLLAVVNTSCPSVSPSLSSSPAG